MKCVLKLGLQSSTLLHRVKVMKANSEASHHNLLACVSVKVRSEPTDEVALHSFRAETLKQGLIFASRPEESLRFIASASQCKLVSELRGSPAEQTLLGLESWQGYRNGVSRLPSLRIDNSVVKLIQMSSLWDIGQSCSVLMPC